MEQPSTPDFRRDLERAKDIYQENLRLVLKLLEHTQRDQQAAEEHVHNLHQEAEAIEAVISHLAETEPADGTDEALIEALYALLEVTQKRKEAYIASTERTDRDQAELQGAISQWDKLHGAIQAFLSNQNRTGGFSLQ